MNLDFNAIHSDGHLVPVEPIPLHENERVHVRLSPAVEGPTPTKKIDVSGMTLHEALVATVLLGAIEGQAVDLSTNASHLEGFGEHDRASR